MQEDISYSPQLKGFPYSCGMPKLDSVRARVLKLVEERPETSLADLSKKVGKSHAYLHQYIHRGSPVELPERVRKRLAALLKVNESELLPASRRVVPVGEEFSPQDDERPETEDQEPFQEAIPQMVGRIGGGSTGAVITIDIGEMQAREEVGEWWRIPPSILRGLARADIRSTVGFAMDGDSMEPTIQRTDIVFIDTNRQKIEPDGIWAVDYGLGRTLKRVLVERGDGQVRYVLKSDNKAYPDQAFDPEEVTVFGRYVGRFSVF